jgi:hypothetical protein
MEKSSPLMVGLVVTFFPRVLQLMQGTTPPAINPTTEEGCT